MKLSRRPKRLLLGLGALLALIVLALFQPWSDRAAPPTQPTSAYSCDNLEVQVDPENPSHYSFTAEASSQGAKIHRYTFEFGDGAATHRMIDQQRASTEHTYSSPGVYKISVTVYLETSDGERVVVTSADCQAVVEVGS